VVGAEIARCNPFRLLNLVYTLAMAMGVRLLGAPSIRDGARWRDVPLDKRLGLLTHLACAEDWVSRERLSFLFWPDTHSAQARINLRQLLARTKALPFDIAVDAEDTRLRWTVDSDVKAFRHAISQEDWRSALGYYRGDLAEGLVPEEASEFANWLEFERSQLRESHRHAALQQADRALVAGRADEAANLYERLLALDPLDEGVLQLLLQMLVQLGAVDEARRRLQVFAARLRAELGFAPAAATELLVSRGAAQSGSGEEPASLVGSGAEDRWPTLTAPLTSFVGREAELRETVQRITSEQCRLLTLLGPGGVGKTRLALRAAQSLSSNFAHGYVAVALASVAAPDALPLRLAAALGVEVRGLRPPLDQLIDYLKERELLLVLDNFEHLTDAALLVQEILSNCPRLKVLITSRERLRLQGEWLLPVAGLPTPPEPAAADLQLGDSVDPLAYDALRLLHERGRQVEPGFTITQESFPAAVRVCRLLEGLPLGIELAAGWLRVMNVHEVLAALEASLDSLPSTAVDTEPRHRTLRVAFEHSWDLLSGAEQRAFSRLAVFHGSFDRAGARGVTGTSLPLLTSLVEKSLLRLTTDGRYDRHPLLQRYMRELLDTNPDEARRLRRAHARYYVKMLGAWSGRLHGLQQPQMLAQFAPDYENLKAAWLEAVEAGWVAECLSGCDPLVLFHGIQGRFTEGERLFAASIERFAARARDFEHGVSLLGSLIANQAWFMAGLGRFDEAVAAAQTCLDLVGEANAPSTVMRAKQVLASVASRRGDETRARHLFEEAITLAESLDDQWGVGLTAGQLGLHELRSGRHAEAQALFERALATNEALGNTPGIVNDLDYLGRLSLEAGDAAAAATRFEQGLVLAEGARFRLRVPYLKTQLAMAKLMLGEREAAAEAARGALAVAEELGQRALQAEALSILGQVDPDAGARHAHLLAALRLADQLGEAPRTLAVLVELAQLLALEPHKSTLLRVVEAHPAAGPALRKRVGDLLGGAESVPGEVVAGRPGLGVVHGEPLSLEGAVRLLLGVEPG